MVAKVILKRIGRSGIVSAAVLAAIGLAGAVDVYSDSDRVLYLTIKKPTLLTHKLGGVSKQPEMKVRTLVSDVTSVQLDRAGKADSAPVSGNLYSQFRRGPSNPGSQPPASAPANPSRTQKVFQAKIKRRAGGTPVIDVVFNGNKSFEMIVDTGASGTLITQQMANALGVKPVRTERAGIADGSIVEFPIGRVQSIGVGGALIRNVEVAIARRMEIGLLGHDFFGNYDVKIKKDVVEFYVR
ncbi:retropepsin-like aspartic protease [Microcoleus sp. herbarium19]|uniref:retropepsin-like aspartic protease family protein n=1 Tax=unclassified Microcoleus TaxID=2642155 RepID=UPI002FD13B76